MIEEELKPCHCAKSKLLILNLDFRVGKWRVACLSCPVKGEIYPTRAAAVAAWNAQNPTRGTHLMDIDKAHEPANPSADGWYWVTVRTDADDSDKRPAEWCDGCWIGLRQPELWRCIGPIPRREDVDALVKAAELVVSEFAQTHPLIQRLSATLTPFADPAP